MNVTADQRKNVKVTPGVKNRLDELKRSLKVKTESEVMAYLISLHQDVYQKITLVQHDSVMKAARDLNNESSL